MRRTVAKVILLLTTVFSLVSGCQCGHDDPDNIKYDRVLIMYSAGFNSLREYLWEDIRDLRSGYAPALKDRSAFLLISHLSDSRGNYSNMTSPQLIRVYKDSRKGVLLDTLKAYESHLSDPATVRTILSDIKRQFPSDHYGMVLSSHATGWLPNDYYNHPEAFEPSYASGRKGVAPHPSYWERELLPGEPLTKSITMTKSSTGGKDIEMELADFKRSIPMHLDYLLLDACLMGCIEVAYALKDECDVIGFSPAEVLAEGFNYKTLAGHLLERPVPDTRAVVDDYFQNYASKSDKTDRAATISLVDCTKLDALASVCSSLFSKYRSEIAGLEPYTVQRYYRYSKHWFYDLEDVLVKAGISDEEHRNLTSALNSCILYKAATEEFLKGYGGFAIHTYSGFSMYLPCNGATFLDSHYKDLDWNKATGLVD